MSINNRRKREKRKHRNRTEAHKLNKNVGAHRSQQMAKHNEGIKTYKTVKGAHIRVIREHKKGNRQVMRRGKTVYLQPLYDWQRFFNQDVKGKPYPKQKPKRRHRAI